MRTFTMEEIYTALNNLKPDAPATPPTPAAQVPTNMDALRNVRPDAVAGVGGVQAAQSDVSQKQAEAYIVRAYPTPGNEYNPVRYAADEFVRAGYSSVMAPNGPVERFGAAAAMLGNDYTAAVRYVIANYPAGTANIAASHSPEADLKARMDWAAAEARMKAQQPPVTPPVDPPPIIEG